MANGTVNMKRDGGQLGLFPDAASACPGAVMGPAPEWVRSVAIEYTPAERAEREERDRRLREQLSMIGVEHARRQREARNATGGR